MKRKISKLVFSVCAISVFVIGISGPDKAFAGAEPFVGELSYVGFNFAPRDWAACNGQLLSIGQNQALYSLLGNFYGGDGRTNFALPDMRGRVPIHQGRGPGLSNYSIGLKGGVEKIPVTVAHLASHSHGATAVSVSTGCPRIEECFLIYNIDLFYVKKRITF